MSTEQPQPPQSELVVDADSVDTFIQRRRSKAILDAMQSFEDKSDAAWSHYVNGEISVKALDVEILRAVKKFIREIDTLLLDYREDRKDDEGDRERQADVYLVKDAQDRQAVEEPLGVIDMVEDREVFWGLYDILQADPFYEETVERSVHHRNANDDTTTFTNEYTVPEEVSQAAYLRACRFLAKEQGIKLRVDDATDSRPFHDWREDFDGF